MTTPEVIYDEQPRRPDEQAARDARGTHVPVLRRRALDSRRILFLSFCVILATLVVAQGLSLSALIRGLGLEDDGSREREEIKYRIKVAEIALARLEELALEEWVREDTAERVRGLYNYRRNRFSTRFSARFGGDEDGIEERSVAYQRLFRELLRAQHITLLELRNEGVIGDQAMHRIERDLDLEESRMET
jgi:hypothetical protein